jgi:hypothetical protein
MSRYKKKRVYNERLYVSQGVANWNVANAEHVWNFSKVIAITYFQKEVNTLGVSFPDCIGPRIDSFAVNFPLDFVDVVTPGFTALRVSDPTQFQPTRNTWLMGQTCIITPPIYTRSIRFIGFGASGSVNFQFNYYFPSDGFL